MFTAGQFAQCTALNHPCFIMTVFFTFFLEGQSFLNSMVTCLWRSVTDVEQSMSDNMQ